MPNLYTANATMAGGGFLLTVVAGEHWSVTDTTLTCSSAPIGSSSQATLSVYSALGGFLRLTDDSRFELSADTIGWGSEVYVDPGTTEVYIGVTPQEGDGTLTASLGVPV